MFRTTHIRTKLAAALAIPLAALVAIAGFEVVSASRDVQEVRSQTQLATSAIGPGSLMVGLQDERNRAAIDLIGLGDAAGLPVKDNEEARSRVDPAVEQLRSEVAGRDARVTEAFAPAFEALGALDALRADVDAYKGPTDLTNDEFADEIFTRYTEIIESFFDATSTIALAVEDANLRNGVEIIDQATRQSEMRARIVRRVVLGVVTDTAKSPAAMMDVAALNDRSHGFDDNIRIRAVGPYKGLAEQTFVEDGVQSFNAQVAGFLAGKDVDLNDMLGAVTSTDVTIGYLGLRDRVSSALVGEATRIEDAATARQQAFAAIALGSLLLAFVVTWLASRSITRPLGALKAQAEEMAGSTLPSAVRQILETPVGEDVVIPEMEPIAVKSRDEVAEVASALNVVQTSALDLAVEQAVLRRNITDSYINLGRRNQNLVSRQLDFITDLERNETDPDALEGLFRLDHLATRMRRNAESLLVLAGVGAPRQWSAPVKVSDVVRAALGEVEDYQRVVVRHLEPAAITGSVASDVAHVLAELIENALSFSPPEQSVEIKGRLMPAGYTVAISDNGLGMSAEDVERANRRLAGRESFTVAPSRYLGHYVAGHLASRLGVVVELQDSPAGGVTARVDVPMSLLADDEVEPQLTPEPAPALTGSDSDQSHAETTPDTSVGPVVAMTAAAPTETALTASGLPRRGGRPGVEPSSAPANPSPAAPAATAGFGGLAVSQPQGASMYSLAADITRDPTAGAPEQSEAAAPEGAAEGLTRRVPGAQRPDVSLGGWEPAAPSPEPAAPDEGHTAPEDVYSFLSSFQSGVAKGRADAHAEPVDPFSAGDDRRDEEDS